MDENEIKKMQYAGMYRDVDLMVSEESDENEVKQKVNELEGLSKNYSDDVLTILEIHVDLDIEGFEDKDSNNGGAYRHKAPRMSLQLTRTQTRSCLFAGTTAWTILSRRKFSTLCITSSCQVWVLWLWFDPHDWWLGRAATSLLRQLIDAGTLANLPAGFKASGVRVRNDDEPLQPGEWRDIDAPGGEHQRRYHTSAIQRTIRNLAAMLGGLVQDGRRFVALADQQIGDMSNEMPCGHDRCCN